MDGETLAWQVIKPGQAVTASDGSSIGTVGRVLADEGADIFHGITLRRGMPIFSSEVEILAASIGTITADEVRTSLDAADVDGLPAAR